MNDIIIDLRTKTLDETTSISALLRIALAVAEKLDIQDIISWIENELNGYDNSNFNKIPEYRKSRASIFGYNPYQGWKTITLESREYEDLVLGIINTQSIYEIEQLKLTNGELCSPLTGEQEIQLHEAIGVTVEIKRVVPRIALDKICNAVRNIILKWVLALEKQGITGKNMSFTPKEKTIAQTNPTIQIENFFGTFGDISNSHVTQEFNTTIEKNNFNTLSDYLLSKGISPDDITSLQTALNDDPSPTTPRQFGKKVCAWIGTMTSKAVAGTLSLSVNVVAGVLTDAISKYYGP